MAHQPGIRLISLQKHHGLEQLEQLPTGVTVETLGEDYDSGPDAFVDCAAVMAGLDLVVTSDSALAHLAGTLGAPTWVVLRNVPDWRWNLSGDTTPWYPTARLFRQDRPGDWDGAMAKVIQALKTSLPK
jgi:ADP-heptose:LPS heptosyltransferase